MSWVGWNCRGLGNSRSVRCLRDLIRTRNPVFVFLSETMVKSEKISEISTSLGFTNNFAVNSVGRGGGLAVMWKRNVMCTILSSSSNHIDVEIWEKNAPSWRITGFYGFPERHRRKDSWEFLKSLAGVSQIPWCVFGDFNDMRYASDKMGSIRHPQALLDGFSAAIDSCQLSEIDLEGGHFTWEKSKGKPNWVRERLDRAFASSSWLHKFPLCKLSVIHTTVSDHDPILLELCNVAMSRKKFRFRFENVWLKEPNFHNEVSDFWRRLPASHILPKLLSISEFMAQWGHKFFHKFRDKVRSQKKVIDDLVNRTDSDGVAKYFEAKNAFNDLLFQEEIYWKQRAKVFWLAEGDSNSKFFHSQASARKRLNYVPYLIDDTGARVDDLDEMCQWVKRYYTDVFAGSTTNLSPQSPEGESVVSESQNAALVAELSFEEFEDAIKQMHPDKASGPDGLNPGFFQHFWVLLGPEIFNCCKQWLQSCSFPAELNDTNIVLIPKKDVVEKMTDLRPIALCNVLYKILAKVLANRLKQILPTIISENQSAFVPGRSITDNVLLAFEMIHFMKQKKSGSEGEVALKLDISKAYDRVEWVYLRQRLTRMGFEDKFIRWVMLCVTTVQYQVGFNGRTVGPISPKRGLRQGDPLSPYLFLLCVEGLSNSLTEAANNEEIHGCKISPAAPAITHLLFADDSFLFFRATQEETTRVKVLLNAYERLSGQAVNFQKSGVLFSANVRRDKQLELSNILEVHNDLSDGRYLGLPSLIGRSKKKVFNFIKDRVAKKIQAWNSKTLSRGGKTVLIKNVAQTIPSYCMSCFKVPKTLAQEIERLMNGYWWSSNGNSSKGIRWLAWEKMGVAKNKGGWAFETFLGSTWLFSESTAGTSFLIHFLW